MSASADGLAPDAASFIDMGGLPDARTSDAGPDAESIQCEPNENLVCANISAIRLCAESGMAYVEQACPEGQRCNAGECIPPPVSRVNIPASMIAPSARVVAMRPDSSRCARATSTRHA